MSIDLDVYLVKMPKHLCSEWQRAFAEFGMVCEFRPDFDPGTWTGGDLIAKMAVSQGGFPGSELYGSRPFVTGCTVDILHQTPKFDESLLARCPRPLKGKLKKAKAWFGFSSSMGRSAAEWRFQIFAAATLAKITDGLLYDPQGGNFFHGEEATKLAEQEAKSGDEHQASRLKKKKTFSLSGFRSWSQALKDSVPEYDEA